MRAHCFPHLLLKYKVKYMLNTASNLEFDTILELMKDMALGKSVCFPRSLELSSGFDLQKWEVL